MAKKKSGSKDLTLTNGTTTIVTVAPRTRYLRSPQFVVPHGTPEDQIERFVERKYGAGRAFSTYTAPNAISVDSATLQPLRLPAMRSDVDYFPGIA